MWHIEVVKKKGMIMNKRTQAIIELSQNEARDGKELVQGQIGKAIGCLRRSGLLGNIYYRGDHVEVDGLKVGRDYLSIKNFIELCKARFNDSHINRAHLEINFMTCTSPVLVIDGKWA